ncbi:MAG: Rpp14/Pop5 family protein [Aigarchaeota archaeon]|nr:Rpp14/Pop5 family protein [Aigarchaeota archaeon]MDW8092603.1 Rpp14/Pop5 family protein [Nitrososphaerota archaeon]
MRGKKRYLRLRLRSDVQVNPTVTDIYNTIASVILTLGGWIGFSQTGLKVWKMRGEPQNYVVRCSKRSLPLVLLATAMVTKIGDIGCALDVQRISGSPTLSRE